MNLYDLMDYINEPQGGKKKKKNAKKRKGALEDQIEEETNPASKPKNQSM